MCTVESQLSGVREVFNPEGALVGFYKDFSVGYNQLLRQAGDGFFQIFGSVFLGHWVEGVGGTLGQVKEEPRPKRVSGEQRSKD